jgi:hypothetical protein
MEVHGRQTQQNHIMMQQQQINVTLNVVVDMLGVVLIVNVNQPKELQLDDEEMMEALHGKM